MYLSTLFLSEIDNGAEYAIAKCNEEFIRRLITLQNDIASSNKPDSPERADTFADQCDEMMALWDVYKEFEEEINIDLPIIEVLNAICAARERVRG